MFTLCHLLLLDSNDSMQGNWQIIRKVAKQQAQKDKLRHYKNKYTTFTTEVKTLYTNVLFWEISVLTRNVTDKEVAKNIKFKYQFNAL